MPIVQMPDGSTVQFPDGMAPADMQHQIETHMASHPAAVLPAPARAPAGNSISQAPALSEWERMRNSVANSAVGRSIESFNPKLASALGLTPTETVNSPTYASDRQQLVAPQYVRPDYYTPSARTRGGNFASGILTGAGRLTSGDSMATAAALAATGGLAAPLATVGTVLKGAGAGMGAYGVGKSLSGAAQAYSAGDTAGGDEQLGEGVPNAALMLPLGWDMAVHMPEFVRRIAAGDVNAPLPGGSGHTPATRYAALQRVGVQPNAADATGSLPLNMVRSVNEKSAAGFSQYDRLQNANLQALTDNGRGLQNGYSATDPLAAGTGVQTSLQKPFLAADDAAAKAGVTVQNAADDFISSRSPLTGEQARLQQQANLLADQKAQEAESGDQIRAVKDAVGDRRALMVGPLRDEALNIKAGNAAADKAVPGLAQKYTGGIIDSFSKLGDPGSSPTIGTLIDLRSRLLDARGNNNELTSGLADRDLDRMIGAVHTSISESMPPDQYDNWMKGTTGWRLNEENYDAPSSPYYSALRGTAPNSLTQGVAGTAPAAIEAMRRNGMDLGIVRRGVAEKLLGTTKDGQYDLPGFGKRLYQMPEENRIALFGNDGNDALVKLAGDYAGIEPTRKAATAFIEDLRNPAFKAAPETLINGIGPRTGSQFARIAPMIGPEGVGAMQRGELTNLMGTDQNGAPNWKTFGRQLALAKEDPGYHGALFGEAPGGSARMDDLATAANMLTARANPSGTAGALQKIGEGTAIPTGLFEGARMALTGSPVEGAITAAAAPLYNAAQYGTAKLMNSPKFVDWLMNPKPAGQPILSGGAASAMQASALVAQQKGETAWAALGAGKLQDHISRAGANSGITAEQIDALGSTPQGKSLLIQASDLAPGSAAMTDLVKQIGAISPGQ